MVDRGWRTMARDRKTRPGATRCQGTEKQARRRDRKTRSNPLFRSAKPFSRLSLLHQLICRQRRDRFHGLGFKKRARHLFRGPHFSVRSYFGVSWFARSRWRLWLTRSRGCGFTTVVGAGPFLLSGHILGVSFYGLHDHGCGFGFQDHFKPYITILEGQVFKLSSTITYGQG